MKDIQESEVSTEGYEQGGFNMDGSAKAYLSCSEIHVHARQVAGQRAKGCFGKEGKQSNGRTGCGAVGAVQQAAEDAENWIQSRVAWHRFSEDMLRR